MGRIRKWLNRLLLLGIVAAVGVFAVAMTIGTGVPAIDDAVENATNGAAEIVNDEPLNTTKIEQRVHYYINQERVEHGREPLTYDMELHRAAEYHSDDMANKGYYGHRGPNGNDHNDRYQYLGVSCDGWSGENIAYTYADQDVKTEFGETVDHNNDEEEIARGLVRQWMNSEGHRENILRPQFNAEGIGIAVTEDDTGTKVIATQNFC